MFFHTQGLRFPYDNMHYVAIAGGNAFYEKRGRDGELQTPAPLPAYEVAMNYVSGQGMSATQSPFVLPETQPMQPASSVATFTPVSNPTVNLPTTTTLVPAEVPIPTPAPTSMSISAPVTDANAVATPVPTSTIAVPQPRPNFDSGSFSGNSLRIRG
jgi:hypothetical protein